MNIPNDDWATIFSDMLGDWPLGTVTVILVFVFILLLLGVAVWGLFVAIDSWFLPRNRKVGRVVGKTFTPAYTQIVMIFNAATKTSLPQPIFHPDDWAVSVEIDGRQSSMSVTKEFYDSLSENDPVLTEYVSGRISRDLYIKALLCV